MFEDMVLKREQELRIKNLKELRDNLDLFENTTKIQNYANKHGFSVEIIKDRIKTDDLVASFFAKDPSKQNFTEILVAELLKVKALPQQGKSCVRFEEEGNLCSIKKNGMSKSADFHINNTYITQKYTRSTGGAQDNQYNDVVDFLTKGSKKIRLQQLLTVLIGIKKEKNLKNILS